MKQVFTILSLLILAGGPTPLRGEDFRIEWLSGRSVQSLKFVAGADTVQLCPIGQKKRCLALPRGATASCARSGTSLLCKATNTIRQFQNFTATSPTLFQVEAASSKSGKSEARRAGQARNAEIRSTVAGTRIVLVLDLENYVAGVLTGEAGILRSPPALEGMAIVARTWALRSRGRHRLTGFDFCSLTHCQVFSFPSDSGGTLPASIALALHQTRGKVLKYSGQLIDVYFSADCGGMTEAAGEIWSDRDAPYLTSIRDPYCAGSEHSSWRQTLALATVGKIVRTEIGLPMRAPLRDLRIDTQDASGRARTLLLEGGSPQRIDANEFRYAVNRRLGWNTLKSNLYTVERSGESLIFTGRGLGHGVGLCQAGAERMGQLNMDSEKILAAYFPGTTLGDTAPLKSSDPILSSEHFELVFPEGQQGLVDESLHALESARSQFEGQLGPLPAKIRVETFATMTDFIRASGQPGWVAASTDGVSISLQPLSTLKRKGILTSTLRHELAHLAIHRQRSPKVPRWFEEGMVVYLTKEPVTYKSGFDFRGRSLEECISKPRSEAEMKAAYARALDRIRTLARERGEAAIWQILRQPSEDDIRRIKN